MCGICGIVNLNQNEVKENDLKKMMFKIKHRGPDDEGLFIEQNVGFGFVRLSIIDLSKAGHQPMTDETGRFIIIYNGEIYNYIELRNELEREGIFFKTKTDTEVLLKLYILYGESCLDKLNGMFAFAIFDKVQKSIFAARDRFGVKPFYYYRDEESFYFASEIPAILSVYHKKNEANLKSIYNYLIFNRTDQTDETFFKDIYKLPHGHYLKIENSKMTIKNWYNLKDKIHLTKGNSEVFRELLTNSIEIRLRSDVPVGVCLSGGLDSSSITSIIVNILKRHDLNTFSSIYGNNYPTDESKYINLFHDQGINMHTIIPTAELLMEKLYDFVQIHAEPLPSTSPFAQYCVMNLAQKYVTVTLDGQGADEQLAGYPYFFGYYYKDLFISFKWFALIKEVFYYLKLHKSLYGMKTFIYYSLPGKLKSKFITENKKYISQHFLSSFDNDSIIVNNLFASKSLREALLNHFEYKLEHLLKWNDRNSMAFSIESRTPFLDYRLVEYSLSLQEEDWIKKGVTKYILRSAMKGILPEAIRNRQDKIGFATPEDEWFRKDPFKTFIIKIILSDSFKERKIIEPRIAFELYNKHLQKKINISKDIWKWIHLELWFRIYIDDSL